MNRRTLLIFIVSFALGFVAGVGVFCVLMPLFNSIFPAVTMDTFNREVHVMPVSNMLWSLAVSVAAGVLVLTLIFKKLKRTYSK